MISRENPPFERKAEGLIRCFSLGSLEVYSKPEGEMAGVTPVALDILQVSPSFWESALHTSEWAVEKTTSGAAIPSCLSALPPSLLEVRSLQGSGKFLCAVLCCCWDIRGVHETSWQQWPQWGEQQRCIPDTEEPAPKVSRCVTSTLRRYHWFDLSLENRWCNSDWCQRLLLKFLANLQFWPLVLLACSTAVSKFWSLLFWPCCGLSYDSPNSLCPSLCLWAPCREQTPSHQLLHSASFFSHVLTVSLELADS